MMNKQNKARGAFFGLVVGDALGTTLEFLDRDTYDHLTTIVGGGPFRLNPGEWTDDTSMALALTDSLIINQGFNPSDLMRRFLSWWENGKYSHNYRCFDIGGTCKTALNNFKISSNPYSGDTHFLAAGNGGLMRLAPAVLFYHNDHDKAIETALLQNKTTHPSTECMHAARIFSEYLWRALEVENRFELFDFNPTIPLDIKAYPYLNLTIEKEFMNMLREEVESTGYVSASLLASLWSVYNTDNFKDAVLLAANLGHDSDTVAAITGQLAGALYGFDQIPAEWYNMLAWKDKLDDWFERLYLANNSN